MIMNPNKTKALVVSISKTVKNPYGDLVLSGVSIRASPNLYILGVKFDSKLIFEDHVRGNVSRVSKRIGILRLVNVYLWTPVCYFVAVFHLFSQSFIYSIVLRCGDQLQNVTFSFLSARCIRWPSFALIRVFCRCVIDVVLLGLVCCTRLLRTLITVCLILLLLQFDIAELIQWSLKYHGVERSNLICKVFPAGPGSNAE